MSLGFHRVRCRWRVRRIGVCRAELGFCGAQEIGVQTPEFEILRLEDAK